MSGDVTYQALERLTHMPDRAQPQGTAIGGQKYYDIQFTGGDISNVAITGGTIVTPSITLDNTGLRVKDPDGSNYLTITPTSNLTANRTLSIATGDANRTLTMAGDITTAGAFPLTLTTTGSTNVTLPTTGTLATTTGALTPSSLTVKDNAFTIQDDVDATKQAQFQLSGITTATTRSYGLPDSNGTLATTGAFTQTFSGSTTFSGGTFQVDGATANFGSNTAASTVQLGYGATLAATTKTLNIGTGGVSTSVTNINIGSAVGGSTGTLTINSPTTAFGANSITMTGSLAATGARVAKGWFTDIESTNAPTIGGVAATGTGGIVRAISPTLTGTPLSTTAAIGTNTTQIATTAYVYSFARPLTNALTGNVALSNAALYFDGPSVAQGTTGIWYASGTVTVGDTGAAGSFIVRLWDGTTNIATTYVDNTISGKYIAISLSGRLSNPAGNIRMSVRNQASTTGVIGANISGLGNSDSTITVFQIG